MTNSPRRKRGPKRGPKKSELLEIKSWVPKTERQLESVMTIVGSRFFEVQEVNKLEERNIQLVIIYELRERKSSS